MKKTLVILGSTGSIGQSTLNVIRQFPERFQVIGLSCHQKIEFLLQQIIEFKPIMVSVNTEAQVQFLQQQIRGRLPQILWGQEGLLELATHPDAELVVSGIVGAAGLEPTYAAIEKGKTIALANKEPMVLAGKLMMETARRTGSLILPTDSEHNAIFQSLVGHRKQDVQKVILTASGGPFRDLPLEQFQQIRLSDALQHPNWKMGPKITIDSATMMNKGLEIIEAKWLFDLDISQIEVVVHRQSIVHSLVHYIDGSLIAQMGMPDMRIPIAYCLGYPERLPIEVPTVDFNQAHTFTFEPVSLERFPCLQLAMDAASQLGAAPAVLNGANEKVVAAYLEGSLHFTQIAPLLKQVMHQFKTELFLSETPSWLQEIQTISDAIQADQWGRITAQRLILETDCHRSNINYFY